MHSLRNWTLRVTPALLGLGLILALGCGSKSQGDDAEKKVEFKMGEAVADTSIAAIVTSPAGTDTLTTAEFRRRYTMVMSRFPAIQGNADQMRELRRRILEDFVMLQAVNAEIKRTNLKADTARISMQMAQIRSQFPNEEAYRQALAMEGMSEDSLRRSVAEMVQQQMLQENMANTAKQPTAAEMESYRKQQAEQIRTSHILFLLEPGAPKQKEDSVTTIARAVLDSVKKGTDFAALARRHSQDGSAQQGGDLDFFSRGQMVPQFEKAAFALKDSGDVAPDLVRTRYGYHIIRLTGKRTSELMDTSMARQMMLGERRQKAVESAIDVLKQSVTVRVNPKVVDTDLNKPLDTF